MTEIRFTIPGRIGGKGRPRFSARNGFARAYTPEKTRSTEAMIRTIAAEKMGALPLLEGPLALDIAIYQQPPASWPKRKRANAKWITGKPDADNTIKLMDALNGIIWKDDSQVSFLTFGRLYQLTEPERVVITVWELGSTASSQSVSGRAA